MLLVENYIKRSGINRVKLYIDLNICMIKYYYLV